jgi:hypothetical protein
MQYVSRIASPDGRQLRDGFAQVMSSIRRFSAADAAAVIDIVHAIGEKMEEQVRLACS